MVTNINLVSPESGKKVSLTGKTTLILSVLLLLLTIGIYVAVRFLSNYYLREKNQVENQIQEESAKISGLEYAELADFQERLNLAENILGDHAYFDSYLKNFSKYVLSDVRLTSLDWKDRGGEVAILGMAANFDALSRELILLKNSPMIQSVEFKNATESSSTEGQSGVKFDLTAKIKKEALNQ